MANIFNIKRDSLFTNDKSAPIGFSFSNCVCAFGVFDGLHIGHQYLLSKAYECSKEQDAKFVVLTFEIDPDDIFAASSFKKIFSNEQRIAQIASFQGVSDVLLIPFDRQVASLSALDFLDTIFSEGTPKDIFIGEGFKFGSRAQGDIACLEKWASTREMRVHPIPLVFYDAAPVSSTRVRKALSEGDLCEAKALLGRPFSVSGEVVHGAAAGADLGFRTANFNIPSAQTVLADGVYAAYAYLGDVRYKAAVSVGFPPTFKGERMSNLEAHILDFTGDIYGKQVTLVFEKRLRDMIAFDDEAKLVSTIKHDIKEVRGCL